MCQQCASCGFSQSANNGHFDQIWQFDNWCQKILAAGTQTVPVNPMTKRWNGNPSPNSQKKFNAYQTRYPQNISGKSQLAVPKLCGVKQRCLVVAVDFLGIQPMLLHEQLSDLAAMGWGLVVWKIWMLRNSHLSTQQNHGDPKAIQKHFMIFLSFFHVVHLFWVKMNDKKCWRIHETSRKIHKTTSAQLPASKACCALGCFAASKRSDPPSMVTFAGGETGDQLQTAPCCWWLLLHLKDADLWHPCPKNCTCLLFIDAPPSSVLCFHVFHSHPNTMEFGWDRGPRFTIWTCTGHMYAHVQTKG